MPLPSGTKLGAYEILAAIGAGGMGEVYRARDIKLGREVAIEESEGKPFLVMELVERETLAERIARGPLPVNEALTLSHQISEALVQKASGHCGEREEYP